MEDYVAEALKQGLISCSTAPVSVGFFFIKKRGGELRPCIDYEGLTMKYAHPLLLIPSAIEQLREVCIYTKLDLSSAYNLVCIQAGNEWKTAFSTTSGHYNVMAYGLTNAPAFFQSSMNDVLQEMINKFEYIRQMKRLNSR